MDTDLRERILSIMDQKDHWAWPSFTRPGLTKAQLAIHFRHEFLTYVRDFPVLLARVLGQGPPPEARGPLARNIDEEETGHYSFGVSHPELFLQMIDGIGIARDEVAAGALEPEALHYRALLDRYSGSPPWFVGAAVVTIFVEGSVHERREFDGARRVEPVDDMVLRHPMVRFYGCPPEAMRLTRAHQAVEGDHRRDAWDTVLRHVPDGASQDAVVEAIAEAHRGWLAYRNGVARAMGLGAPPSGAQR
ncbi:MAG TPA: iron-containing redox enzyme family protein [Polyangiaceae bacterium]|nr:iron-containing redox enzyme family protein [Polyangiaceae bacterium]